MNRLPPILAILLAVPLAAHAQDAPEATPQRPGRS